MNGGTLVISSTSPIRLGVPVASLPASAAAEATPSAPPLMDGFVPEGVSPATAMEILQKAREMPECRQIGQKLEAARASLTKAEGVVVDPKVYGQRAFSSYGLIALLAPPVGSMLLLPHLGLTGAGAIAGLIGGFLLAPALATWGVRKMGEANAREAEAAAEYDKSKCRAAVQTLEQQADQQLKTSMERLFQEHKASQAARAADPNANVTTTETKVKLGNVVVSKRTEENSPSTLLAE